MRAFVLFFMLFSQPLFAVTSVETQDLDKKIESFIKTLSATNNMEVFLKSQRKQMTVDAYNQLLKIVNGSADKNKFYQIKKISNRAFAIKLNNSIWAPITFSTEGGGLLIGKTPFLWSNKKSIQANLDQISEIMTAEFGQDAKTASHFLIPEAQAQSKTISPSTNDTVAVGLAASINNWLDADIFLSFVDKFCNDKKALRGSPKTIGEIRTVKAKFEASKAYFEPKLGNVWGNTITHEAYAKFDRAQRCLKKHAYITEHDFLPIAVEEGAKAENNGVSQ